MAQAVKRKSHLMVGGLASVENVGGGAENLGSVSHRNCLLIVIEAEYFVDCKIKHNLQPQTRIT